MIKYRIQEKVDEKDERGIQWREPDEQLFNTKEKAIEYEEQLIKKRKRQIESLTETQRQEWVEVLDYKVVEHQVKEKVVVKGLVGDNGQSWDDYRVLVNNKNTDYITGHNYKGNKIKVTIEVIEE